MAFTPCTSTLTGNIKQACDVFRVKGYERIGLIVNKQDIDWAASTVSLTNKRIVTNLALKAGKKATVIYNSKQNPLPFNGTQSTFNRDMDGYDKVVQFYYEGIGADAAKDIVEPLKNGEYIVILERKDKTGHSFQIIGYEVALSCSNDGGAQVQNEETGYWLMTMTTTEHYAEMEYLNSNYATTKTSFDLFVDGALGE